MGGWNGDYSRDMLPSSRRKQYAFGMSQQGKEVADADKNDTTRLQYEKLRAFLEKFGGDIFFFDDAFKITGNASSNDFRVDPGSGYAHGHELYLGASARYENSGASPEDRNLHSISTNLSATVLTDSAMSWAVDELAGRNLVPDIEDGTTFLIVSNTATTVTVAGDMTVVAEVGDSYLVAMSTPSGSNRDDAVWANLYLDEIDAAEDSYLYHNLGTGIELDRRIKVRTIIMVEQGTSAYTDYVDLDGNQHRLVKLSTLHRFDGQAAINPGDLDEARQNVRTSGSADFDEKVKISPNDSTPDHLISKVVPGTGITVSEINDGGNETLQIAAPNDTLVKISVNDDTPNYLHPSVVLTSPLDKAIDPPGPGADEKLRLLITDPADGTKFLSGTHPPTWAVPLDTKYVASGHGAGTASGTGAPLILTVALTSGWVYTIHGGFVCHDAANVDVAFTAHFDGLVLQVGGVWFAITVGYGNQRALMLNQSILATRIFCEAYHSPTISGRIQGHYTGGNLQVFLVSNNAPSTMYGAVQVDGYAT